MEEVKLAALERGLSAFRKRKNGPIIVMEPRSGKSIGSFATKEDALASILKVALLPEEKEPEAVGWHWDVEYMEIPRSCSNGWGRDCICLDQTALYLCAAPPCKLQARCQGICTVHYSQLRVFGDLTEYAIKKTAAMAERGEFDLEHLPPDPRILAIKNYFQTAIHPTYLSPGEITEATAGVLGMNIKWTGTAFVIVDRDGLVLDSVASKKELFEEYEEDPDEGPEEGLSEDLAEADNAIIEERTKSYPTTDKALKT